MNIYAYVKGDPVNFVDPTLNDVGSVFDERRRRGGYKDGPKPQRDGVGIRPRALAR